MSIQPYIDAGLPTDPDCYDAQAGREERYNLGRVLFQEMPRDRWYLFNELTPILDKHGIAHGIFLKHIRLLTHTVRRRVVRHGGHNWVEDTEYAIIPSLGGPMTEVEKQDTLNRQRAAALTKKLMRPA